MPRHLHLEPHLTSADLEARYRGCRNPVERSHWHFLWLLARGLTATAVSRVTGYSAYWVGQIARRHNRDGPDGVRDPRQHPRPRARRPWGLQLWRFWIMMRGKAAIDGGYLGCHDNGGNSLHCRRTLRC